MITVEDLFSRLARGMLKNTSAVEDSKQGEIVPDYEDSVYYLLNEGLNEVFTKKLLMKRRIKVSWISGQSLYRMEDDAIGISLNQYDEDPDFNASLFVKFLNVAAILGDNQENVRLTPDTGDNGVSTPSYNELRVSPKVRETYPLGLAVVYQARHPKVSEHADEIILPPALEYALQLYVASRYISEMGSADQAKRGDELRALYLREMGEDTAQNMSSTSDVEKDVRFTDRGFV